MAKVLMADATRGQYMGDTMNYTPSGAAVEKGDFFRVGQELVVALEDIADGATGTVARKGAFLFPKVDAAVIGQGETVDFDVSAGKIDDNAMTGAAGDLSDCGVALEAKGATTDAYILVSINDKGGTVGT